MQKIFNATEILEMEQRLLEERNDWDDSSEMLAHKAIAVCNRIKQDILTSHRAVIFAGPNEKGALAIRLAHALIGMQYDVDVVLLNPKGNLPPDLIRERDDFLELSTRLTEVTTNAFTPPVINPNDLLIDGIQGVELLSSLNNVIKYLNTIKAIKVALEMPSGMCEQQDGAVDYTKIFKADLTYTFYSPKLPFLLAENAPYVGHWKVVIPSYYTPIDHSDAEYAIFDTQEMERIIPLRKRFSNKYDYGKDLLIAGSERMMGAALLAGKAAVVSGAGHLTLHIPEGQSGVVFAALPEALVSIDPSAESFSTADLHLSDYSAIAIGPGLGRSMESYLAFEQLLSTYQQPIIIDADALYLLAQDDSRLLSMVTPGSILTPHIGEFDRLFGPSRNSRERLDKLQDAAKRLGIYILLKGAYTATALPTGQIVFNLTGNPGLATAGTGDVLTGMVLAFLGKKHSQKEACLASAFLHGFAAENYCLDYSEESLTAGHLIEYLPYAFKRFSSANPVSIYI